MLGFTVNGYAVRNYTYDADAPDSPYLGSGKGRLTKVDHLQGQGSVRFQEFYSYTQAGAVATKTLRYLRTDMGYSGISRRAIVGTVKGGCRA